MTIKIIADRTAKNTKVITPNGEDISKYIRKLNIDIQAGGLVLVTAEIKDVELNIEGFLIKNYISKIFNFFRKMLGE